MYLPIYSPTRIIIRLKLNGKQVYKKEFHPSLIRNIKTLDEMKKFICKNTRFTKNFDSYFIDIIEEEIINPNG